MKISHCIEIESSPEKVFETLQFFFRNSENYRLWHPDHLECFWESGHDFTAGSVLVTEEMLHGALHRLKFRLLEYCRNEFLGFKMLFPMSLICSGGSFKAVAKANRTDFIAELDFRFGALMKVLFQGRMNMLKQHMKEEGENLKAFIEKDVEG